MNNNVQGKTVTEAIEFAKRSGIWSTWLEKDLGSGAALSLAIGLTSLRDLTIGDRDCDYTNIKSLLPPCYIEKYDNAFFETFLKKIDIFFARAKSGESVQPHTVLGEIIIMLAMYEANDFYERHPEFYHEMQEKYNFWMEDDWAFELFTDADVKTCLYDIPAIGMAGDYAYDLWMVEQFWVEDDHAVSV